MTKVMKLGDHVYVWRLGYTHHGIYVGNDEIIHFSDGYIRRASVAAFCNGAKWLLYNSKANGLTGMTKRSREGIVMAAQSRLGEGSYALFNNNCEHFANWCTHGEHYSGQVEEFKPGILLIKERRDRYYRQRGLKRDDLALVDQYDHLGLLNPMLPLKGFRAFMRRYRGW